MWFQEDDRPSKFQSTTTTSLGGFLSLPEESGLTTFSRVDLQHFLKLTLLNFHGKIVDIIDGTRIKSCYDNSIDRKYPMESLSVWYFTHELVVLEIEHVCAANRWDFWYKPTRCFLFLFLLCILPIPHNSPQRFLSHLLKGIWFNKQSWKPIFIMLQTETMPVKD